jgi:hypothetical protein
VAGTWTWSIRDSDRYGTYLITRPDRSRTKLRILGDPRAGYLLDISFDPRDVDGKPVADHLVREELEYSS